MEKMISNCTCGKPISRAWPIRQLKQLPDGTKTYCEAGYIGTCGQDDCRPVVISTNPEFEFPPEVTVLRLDPPQNYNPPNEIPYYFETGF